jgi:hypothetical protein
MPSGWRNVPSGSRTAVYDGPAGPVVLDVNGIRLTLGVHRVGAVSFVDSCCWPWRR